LLKLIIPWTKVGIVVGNG